MALTNNYHSDVDDSTTSTGNDSNDGSTEEPKKKDEDSISTGQTHTFDGVTFGEQEENSQNNHHMARIYGAGAAGALVGIVLSGGIVFASILGVATAYSATRDDATGDVARAMGDVALTAREKARKLDDEHHLVDKSKAMANDAWVKVKEIDTAQVAEKSKVVANNVWEKAKEIDQKHDVVGKVKEISVETAQRVAEFDREHNVVAWTAGKFEQVVTFLAEKFKRRSAAESRNDHLVPVVLD
uniref:Uncharacterized protein n=1 Tax=Helicotheca tamesis TaxID=374047 RepID=A0A7S2IEL1_9STRA|mmetsp:Transcript_8624/g.11915  ORF Transcript_8624/g.11915 Transcript_8624/m.11915 type:complete len:242 (+) Transcript_8624:68-793(+)|eukprot:CAMPEP_0185723618 /NCGR_PEP_ID=MMETSP1171-20130828/402_1 /TAXON_ID=374046 /ORGANISM="Helicotheca tamensis, Strain CCMP826" /LENGTH=241 /DNA_ID=CAMNT_0028391353 /DNA_START=64 /DNA_END=789 /DNA_ORIENTATION=+